MATDSEERTRAEIVEVARLILDGNVGVIEGARRITDLREVLGIYHLDEDFVGFVVIASETETLPIGDVRELWNKEALVDKDREVEEAEGLYRQSALEDCRRLIARFGGASNKGGAPDRGHEPADIESRASRGGRGG